MFKIILLYYNTLKYLKPVQVRYRVFYFLRNRTRKSSGFKYKLFKNSPRPVSISLVPGIFSEPSYQGNKTFAFLNKQKQFVDRIDWDYSGFGKLWTYNLNYFEYLNQKQIDKNTGTGLIKDFINNIAQLKIAQEPYPLSLRIVNWIKFLLFYNIQDKKINDSLYAQAFVLYDNIEYHLLGNHFLENGFALFFSGLYFGDKNLLAKGEDILSTQLEEQILTDGAHFELSPMYHQLMFYRLLDLINIAKNSRYENREMLTLLMNKAGMMYSWLENITFSNGDIPLFNDSAVGIAPESKELFKYAKRLGIHNSKLSLRESGYRKFIGKHYEMVVDIGKIGPDYLPGHGHNDIFGFVLYIRNKPVVVDTGTSVYGSNPVRRLLERSTESHNTVKVGDYEQAEIWSDFRVARRSYPEIIYESNNKLIVEYRHFSKKYTHRRQFIFKDSYIEISDTVFSQLKSVNHLHFDSDIYPMIEDDIIDLALCKIEVANGNINKKEYLLSKGFGKLQSSKKVEIEFYEKMRIKIDVM